MGSAKINILSLCSGLGGLELGIHSATRGRTRVVGYVERDAFASACLLARMEETALEPAPVWCGDLRDFPAGDFYGVVDGITAGYPCQPFSVAGRQLGERDERHIFPDILRIIGTVEPVFCFFENVPGHLTNGLQEVSQSLEDLGFSVACGLFSAEEVGAPHRRERLFILAYKDREFLRIKPGRGCWQSRKGTPIPGNDSLHLGDSSGQGLEKPWWAGATEYPQPFPPGPDGDWKGVPEWLHPASAKPSVCRVAHGVPPSLELARAQSWRADKLKALGNAVVPATARLAFESLVEEVIRSHKPRSPLVSAGGTP